MHVPLSRCDSQWRWLRNALICSGQGIGWVSLATCHIRAALQDVAMMLSVTKMWVITANMAIWLKRVQDMKIKALTRLQKKTPQTLVPQLQQATDVLKHRTTSGHDKLHPVIYSLALQGSPVNLDHSQDEEFKILDFQHAAAIPHNNLEPVPLLISLLPERLTVTETKRYIPKHNIAICSLSQKETNLSRLMFCIQLRYHRKMYSSHQHRCLHD